MYNLYNQCRIVADISAYKEGVEIGQVRTKEHQLAGLFRSVQIHHHARHVSMNQQSALMTELIIHFRDQKLYQYVTLLALKIQSHADKISQTNGYANYLKYHLANQIATLEYAATYIVNFPELRALKDIICSFFRQSFLTAPYIVCPLMLELFNTQVVRDIYLTQFNQTHSIQILNYGHQFNMNYQQYNFNLYDDDYGYQSAPQPPSAVYSQYGQSTAYNPYASQSSQGNMTDSQYQQYQSTNPYANQPNQQQNYQYPQQPPQTANTQPYSVPQPPVVYQQSYQQQQQAPQPVPQPTATNPNYAPMPPQSQYQQYPQNEQAKSYQPNYNYPPVNVQSSVQPNQPNVPLNASNIPPPNPPPNQSFIPNQPPPEQYYNQQSNSALASSNYQQPVATAPLQNPPQNYNDTMVQMSQASTQQDQLTKMTTSINYSQHQIQQSVAPTQNQPQYTSQTGYPNYQQDNNLLPQSNYQPQQPIPQYNAGNSQGQFNNPPNPNQLPPPPPPPPPPQPPAQQPPQYQPPPPQYQSPQTVIQQPKVQEPSRDEESLFEALLLNENIVKQQLRDSTGKPTLVSGKTGFRQDKITKGFKNHDEQSLYILKCYIDGKYAQTKIDRTQEMKSLVST